MGVHDAPQWLISAFVRACLGAGATATPEEIEKVGDSLIDRWSEEGRHFHNLRHLTDVLARVDELAEETHEPDLVRLGAWYHGAIFDAAAIASYAHRGGEDEQASADLARTELTDLGVPPAGVARVAHLVTVLARHNPDAEDFDCAVLCDADLAMLASEPQRYKAYLADVRAEYAHLPVEEFVRARITILRKLERRSALFSSPLGAAWEEPARQNLAAELHRLEKELRKIEAAAPPPEESTEAGPEAATDGTTGPAATVPETAPSTTAG
ncbi:HD domain-containing protein [Actinotalea soli]|uniref:HD domain-containing protein n=1 Tax=Actinotalea soli TaxID=2819234 RepID=UPI001FB62E13|nr:hypothetical protein [Actinotalea soli]